MNRPTDQEGLLADVLAEEAREGFSAALLAETLRLARRKRQWRQVRRGSVVAALLLLAGLGIWQSLPRAKPPTAIAPPPAAPASYQLIVSQPLLESQMVATQPLAAESTFVANVMTPTIRTYGGGFREVGDDELLSLAAPQTAALVRRGPHEAELVLVPVVERSSWQEN